MSEPRRYYRIRIAADATDDPKHILEAIADAFGEPAVIDVVPSLSVDEQTETASARGANEHIKSLPPEPGGGLEGETKPAGWLKRRLNRIGELRQEARAAGKNLGWEFIKASVRELAKAVMDIFSGGGSPPGAG